MLENYERRLENNKVHELTIIIQEKYQPICFITFLKENHIVMFRNKNMLK